MNEDEVAFVYKRVALYLRLSKEDIDKIGDEAISESIKNQELMLKEEVAKHKDWIIVEVFCDEDFSGAGTYRPDFERLISFCEEGKVDIILCKSQSRFSRDVEVIEKYIHNKFQEWNVRFISLIDHADTENQGNKKARQINALVNEWFLEDLSDNIKATFKAKWRNGECTSSFAKYGLMKDPRNKNHLLIDPVASEVLKLIARLFLSGYGQEKIAMTLEKMGIPSPYEYKALNGCKLKLPMLLRNNDQFLHKVGKYIIRFSLFNRYKQKLKCLKSLFMFGVNRKISAGRFFLRVRLISEDLQLFYLARREDEDDFLGKSVDFTKESWVELKVGDEFYLEHGYIGCFNQELDRLIETGFELEVELRENVDRLQYYLFTTSFEEKMGKCELFSYEIRKKYQWSGRVIYQLLRDEAYHGVLVQGKTKRVSYKNHKCYRVNEDQWVVCFDALEKVFDDDTWRLLKKRLSKATRVGKTGVRHVFSGMVYCMECGSILRKNCSYAKGREKVEYLLCKDKLTKWANCNNRESIKLADLVECITHVINEFLDKYGDIELLRKLYQEKTKEDNKDQKTDQLRKKREAIQEKITKKDQVFRQLYEDKVSGVIDEDDFVLMRVQYKEELQGLRESLAIIDQELTHIMGKKDELNEVELFSKNFCVKKLSLEWLNGLIERIEVGKIDRTKGVRKIKVIWNF